MKEVDVRDYYLISKKDLQKINEFTRDGFFMATVNLMPAEDLCFACFKAGAKEDPFNFHTHITGDPAKLTVEEMFIKFSKNKIQLP